MRNKALKEFFDYFINEKPHLREAVDKFTEQLVKDRLPELHLQCFMQAQSFGTELINSYRPVHDQLTILNAVNENREFFRDVTLKLIDAFEGVEIPRV